MFRYLKIGFYLSMLTVLAAGCSIKNSGNLSGKVNTQDKCGPALVQANEFDSCKIKLLAPLAAQELRLQPSGEYVFAFSYTGNCGANFDLLITGNPFNLDAGTNLFRSELKNQPSMALALAEPSENSDFVPTEKITPENSQVKPSEPLEIVGYFSIKPVAIGTLTSTDGNYHWVVSANQTNPASTCFQKLQARPNQ